MQYRFGKTQFQFDPRLCQLQIPNFPSGKSFQKNQRIAGKRQSRNQNGQDQKRKTGKQIWKSGKQGI